MERDTAAEEPLTGQVVVSPLRGGTVARSPRHALHQAKRSWPPYRKPLIAMAAASVVSVCVLLWLVSDGSGEGPEAAAGLPPALLPSESAAKPATPAPEPTPTTAAAQGSVTPSSPPASRPPERVTAVALTQPRNNERLAEDRDFFVQGTARDLGDDDLRLFLYSERRRTFYLADYGPQDVAGDGRWSIRSAGIGREWGGDGDAYLVQVVRADRSCQRSLDGLELGNDRYPAFPALPGGCRVLAQVRVVEA